jgi:actin-related protein 3
MSNEKLKKKYDKYIDGIDTISKAPFKVSVGPERFLAPEMFFNPEIVDEKYRQPVDELVDKVIQLCPIDTRRQLYSNIALSGGSTLFKGFKERLERRVRERVDDRLRKYEALSNRKVFLVVFSQLLSM